MYSIDVYLVAYTVHVLDSVVVPAMLWGLPGLWQGFGVCVVPSTNHISSYIRPPPLLDWGMDTSKGDVSIISVIQG